MSADTGFQVFWLAAALLYGSRGMALNEELGPMTDVRRHSIRPAADWSIALSLLITAAGLFAIGLPGLAGVAVDVLVGWLLLFRGVLLVLFAARAGTTGAIVREVVS